ncbi:hypothetical protein AGR4C_pa60038 [Agrobacterium tumefaciens str. Kerr 14]|uniref:Uncharacterized protein n=1 Tax=Agrobacterium tumefaciens str. Kerr 14 TaxID=1183424 RepID=A0A1S7SB70_AGRTU|nr:hypothetical protein [Agrobacterium tumefaciens]CUX65928.1 hypothetical protein AGR4C_pa60038 [Agrobacterium tumefaciens str. Kerr 14]
MSTNRYEVYGGQTPRLKGHTTAKKNVIEFAFWRGKAPATGEEQDAAKIRARKELEEFADGAQPKNEAALKLHMALNNGSARVKLTIITIDPDNETTSFSGPMRQLDKFLPRSRERFLADAVSHLSRLRPEQGEFGSMYALCHALVKARADAGGTLGSSIETKLDEIRNDAQLPAGKALRSVEQKRAETELGGGEEKSTRGEVIGYDARDRAGHGSGLGL